MTFKELLNCSAEELESFTPAQMEEWLKQYLPMTRPELQPPKPEKKILKVAREVQSKKQKVNDILAQYNLNIRL